MIVSGRIGILIAVVGIYLAQRTKEGPCTDDAVLEFVEDDIQISPCHVFSETYDQARERFLAAAKTASAELYSLDIVENYTTDIAIVPGDLPGLLFHSSGVHGVEGYAGSAIQVAWLSQFSKQRNKLPTMVFIHAVNPHGMAHYRRWNEHNVDLNRNALHEDEWEAVLSRDPNIAKYVEFDETLFNPRRPPTLWDDKVGFWIQAAVQLAKYGLTALKRSMVAAQYHNSQGIFFGGRELQPSLVKLRDFLKDKLPELMSNVSTVTWIDVHTGLGKSGMDTLLVKDTGTWSPQRLAQLFPGSTVPGLDRTGDSVKAGYDLTIGTLETFALKLFASSETQSPTLFITQEFGTVPTVRVGKAMVLENMAHHYLHDQEEAQSWALSQIRPAFYVRTSAWRRSVLQNGLRLLKQGVARSITE